MSNPDNCALAKDGTLKDANDIEFFNSPSNKRPIGYKGSDNDAGSASSGSDLPTVVPLLERALIVKGKHHSRKTEKVKGMEADKSMGKGKGEGAEVHPFFKKGSKSSTLAKPTTVPTPVEKHAWTDDQRIIWW
ncbi:uncharacterized protein LACBIDRAFT_312785 [Laccaria bicolor S238N-H82]|uniref:Predicted protein n=1 Tax=Laccaria bicolor (strain S238N-H82 / ATCC MYA-4686) TaxID=486041 RepID=B0DWP6_LACBS|nr:uncharacterized protein LACBIDRAFT_312785 [Laccaria bicolor S238N-H82]EDR01019.1 predicted protein [Laccaria bicolor S238N-H82]|eukprot:XP_001888414.1 predicted protein [Laccaria bicolor S238N-H82]